MGHNWLSVLSNTTGFFSGTTTYASAGKNAPGGCARCHLTPSYKHTLAEDGITQADWSGTGKANFASLFGNLASDPTQQKKANTIECLLCHASTYKPISVTGNTYDATTLTNDKRTVFNAGQRKPSFMVTGVMDDVYPNFFSNMTSTYFADTNSDGVFENQGAKNIWIAQDLSQTALDSISKTPANEACLRCHDFAGGGPRNKRGMWFRPGYDVHASMNCLDCHKTDKMKGGTSSHKMSIGLSTDIWARDLFVGDAQYTDRTKHDSECANGVCHGTRPHKNKLINDHYAAADSAIGDGIPSGRVDCRTCHIPYQYGQKTKDFTKAVLNTSTGIYDAYTENRTSGTLANYTASTLERPVYKWFNGLSDPLKHGPSHDVGRTSTQSRIAPFTSYTITAIVDGANPATAKKIPLKFGVFAQTGNIYASANLANVGATVEANMTYTPYPTASSGTIYSATGTSNFLIGHRVRPAAEALKCADCHSTNTILPYSTLTYTDEEAGYLKSVLQK